MNNFNIEAYEKCIQELDNNECEYFSSYLTLSTFGYNIRIFDDDYGTYIDVCLGSKNEGYLLSFTVYPKNNRMDIRIRKSELINHTSIVDDVVLYNFCVDNIENNISYFPKLRTALYNFMARNEDIMKEIKKDLQEQLDSVYSLFSNSITNLFLGGDNE